MQYRSLWPTFSLRSKSGHIHSLIPNFHVAWKVQGKITDHEIYVKEIYLIMRLKVGYTDYLSRAIIFKHQIVFKIYGKITGPFNRGHSESRMHGRTDERTER